jgi:pimeloyl-ACP methyl ester carboxylesterase
MWISTKSVASWALISVLAAATACSSDTNSTQTSKSGATASGKAGSQGSKSNAATNGGVSGRTATASRNGQKAGTGGSNGKASGSGGSTALGSGNDCSVVVADADCDKSQRPIVFVHGTYGSGDNIANVALLFGSNGYCQDRFVAVEYNSLGSSPVSNGSLDKLIDKVLQDTGFDKVDLAGHSQGTGHCVNYLGDPAHAAKVAHYISYSGAGTVPNGVPSLGLSSMNDLGGTPHFPANADKTVTFTDEDHFGVAASKRAFVETWKYLHDDKDPQYTEVQCGEDPITLEGIAETFADNTVITGSKLEVREVDPNAEPGKMDDPIMTITPEADGHIGPIQLKRLVQYDFKAINGLGKVMGHLYYSPFKRSNRLVRFLSPSATPLVASMSTDRVVKGDGFSALVGRYLAGAFRHDLGDSLKINGEEVLVDANAGKTQIVVGLFISDQNMNGKTDLGGTSPGSFLMLTDVFMDASKPGWIDLSWTPSGGSETKMTIPNWPSSTEGILGPTFQ